MADTKISALTAVTTPAGTDEFPVNQGGTSKKVTLAQIVDHVGIRRLQRTLSAAEMKAASTPVELIAAPGAGFWITPIWISFTLTYTAPAYGVSGTATIRYAASTVLVSLAAALPNTASIGLSQPPGNMYTFLTAFENKAIEFHTSVDLTSGNSNCAFDIFYAITPVPA